MTPLLNNITVATPCAADWNTMQGTEQVRFCQQCQLNVYNLSGMSGKAAEALIQSQEGRLCVRFYQRPDGTILTQDCPVGLQALHRRKITRWGSLAAAVTIVTVMGAFCVTSYAEQPAPTQQTQQSPIKMGKPTMREPIMGDRVAPKTTQTNPGPVMQGNMAMPLKQTALPVTKKPCKFPKKRPALMGAPSVTPNPTPMIMGKMMAPTQPQPAPITPPETTPPKP